MQNASFNMQLNLFSLILKLSIMILITIFLKKY